MGCGRDAFIVVDHKLFRPNVEVVEEHTHNETHKCFAGKIAIILLGPVIK